MGSATGEKSSGGAPGDLYTVVHVAPDPRFERDGVDLWRTETISVPDAVLGARIEVPTLEGGVELAVPPGTQPGAVLRLRGKGLPRLGGGLRGDLNVRVEVRVPESPSPEERELYVRLGRLHAARGRRRLEP